MQLTHIKLDDYKSWQDYYWDYQYKLAQNYYIPLLKKWKIQLKGKRCWILVVEMVDLLRV